MLLVEYRVFDKLKVISENTGTNKKVKLRGKFQKCDEQNNNGRVYPKKILESQVKEIQAKISERSLVGALDHPPNDAIHLSQASHLITKLWVEENGDVMGECEILSTPSGKIVEALINDNVKIGISSRGLGTLSEVKSGHKVVNEDFKLITFDLVSDPSTKGAYPELTESVKRNSEKAQEILKKMKKERVLITLLESKINSKIEEAKRRGRTTGSDDGYDSRRNAAAETGLSWNKENSSTRGMPKAELKDFDIEGFKAAFKKNIQSKKRESALSTLSNLFKKKLKSPHKKVVVESIESLLTKLQESKNSDEVRAIKSYLVNHLQDLYWNRPIKPFDSSVKAVDVDTEKIEFIEKVLKVIKSL